jgi:hypothetical protein
VVPHSLSPVECTAKRSQALDFCQRLSIHFFAKHEDNMKQLPGVFVLMSRKRKKDYKKVLQQIHLKNDYSAGQI